MAADGFDRLWRPTTAAQVAGGVFVVGGVLAIVGCFTAAGVAAVRSDTDAIGGWLFVAGLCGALPLLGWRFAIHPFIGATDAGVLVRNPIRSVLIPWSEIVSCTPGYSGIAIRRRKGEAVVAWAVQKANVSQWLGRTVRADRVAAYIEARAHGPL